MSSTLLMQKPRTFYDVLGINKNANNQEIRRAYKELLMKYQASQLGAVAFLNDDDFWVEKFKELNQAYNILLDEKKRIVYDIYQKNQSLIDGFPSLSQNRMIEVQEYFGNFEEQSEEFIINRSRQYQKQSEATHKLLDRKIELMREKIGDHRVTKNQQYSKMIVQYLNNQANHDCEYDQDQDSEDQLDKTYTEGISDERATQGNSIDILMQKVLQLNQKFQENQRQRPQKYRDQFGMQDENGSEAMKLEDLLEQSNIKLSQPSKMPYLITKKTISKQQEKETHQKIIKKIQLRQQIFKLKVETHPSNKPALPQTY